MLGGGGSLGTGNLVHRPPAPLCVPRPKRLPGTRTQPRPRAADAQPRARALPAPPRQTHGHERACVPPNVPGSPARASAGARRAGVKRRRRPRLRATDPGVAGRLALLLGDFFFPPKFINLGNLTFLNGAGPGSAGGFLCFKMGFAVSVVGTTGGLIVSLLRAFLRPEAEHCL